MEVAEGIHRVETPFAGRVNAVHLFAGAAATMLVDTATRDTAGVIGDYLDAHRLARADVRYVLNTHCDWDHTGGNGVLRDVLPRALFCCHELDRPLVEDVELLIDRRYGEYAAPHGYDESADSKAAVRAGTAPTAVDIGLSGGEWVHLGAGWRVQVLHTPGHSAGSICVYDPRSGSVVLGDAVLGEAVPLAGGEPAFPPTYRQVDSYLASIDLLLGLAPDALLPAHHPVYRGTAAREFLTASQRYVQRVEDTLRARLSAAGGPVRMADLVAALSAPLGDWPPQAAPALHFPLSGHLERLAGRGLVQARGGTGGLVEYRWQGAP
jgi:glyoxylase-like metal-dependent hydrolase (beta-lactamase superfamily II)